MACGLARHLVVRVEGVAGLSLRSVRVSSPCVEPGEVGLGASSRVGFALEQVFRLRQDQREWATHTAGDVRHGEACVVDQTVDRLASRLGDGPLEDVLVGRVEKLREAVGIGSAYASCANSSVVKASSAKRSPTPGRRVA